MHASKCVTSCDFVFRAVEEDRGVCSVGDMFKQQYQYNVTVTVVVITAFKRSLFFKVKPSRLKFEK